MKLQQDPCHSFGSYFQAEILILESQLSYTAAALQPHLCLTMYPTDPNPDLWIQLSDLNSNLPCCYGLAWQALNCGWPCSLSPDWSWPWIADLSYHYGFVWWSGLVTVTGLDLFHLVQVLWAFPTAREATTSACLSATCGYWLPFPCRRANPCSPTTAPEWCLWPSAVTECWGCNVLCYHEGKSLTLVCNDKFTCD